MNDKDTKILQEAYGKIKKPQVLKEQLSHRLNPVSYKDWDEGDKIIDVYVGAIGDRMVVRLTFGHSFTIMMEMSEFRQFVRKLMMTDKEVAEALHSKIQSQSPDTYKNYLK